MLYARRARVTGRRCGTRRRRSSSARTATWPAPTKPSSRLTSGASSTPRRGSKARTGSKVTWMLNLQFCSPFPKNVMLSKVKVNATQEFISNRRKFPMLHSCKCQCNVCVQLISIKFQKKCRQSSNSGSGHSSRSHFLYRLQKPFLSISTAQHQACGLWFPSGKAQALASKINNRNRSPSGTQSALMFIVVFKLIPIFLHLLGNAMIDD